MSGEERMAELYAPSQKNRAAIAASAESRETEAFHRRDRP